MTSAVLETPRLLLRRVTNGDAEFIMELLNEPSFIKNIGDRGVRSPAGACGYIQDKLVASYERLGYGLYLVLAKETRIPMGISGFVKRDVLEYADLGFAFKEEFWSRRFAYESAEAVIRYGREVLGFDRIHGIAAPHNLGSIRLLEKVGLRYERMIHLPGFKLEQKLFSSPVLATTSKEDLPKG